MKKALVLLVLLSIAACLYADSEYAKGLVDIPDRLKQALPEAQPNGLITANNAMPGDGRTPETLPGSVDLSEYLPPIGSQGSIGSCSAWSTIYYSKSIQENMERGWGADDDNEIFSPLFTYNQITNGRNEGTAITDHMAIVQEQGCATLATFPEKYDLYARPSSAAMNEAALYKASSYESLDDYDETYGMWSVPVERVKTLLAEGYPVVVGFELHETFDAYTGGIYDYVAGVVTGGHAMCIVGYDDFNGTFKIVNSWGDFWGEDGFLYMTYDVFSETATYGSGVLYDHTTQTDNRAFPPSNIEASWGTFEESIKVTWDSVEGTDKYIVFRSNNEDATLAEIDRTYGTSYTDSPLPPGVTYIYAVKAVNSNGLVSDFSPIAEGSTGSSIEDDYPGTPANVEFFYNSDVALFYWDEVYGAEGYTIYRWNDTQENWISYGSSRDNYFLDPGINTYERGVATAWYIICAYNGYGESMPSRAMSIPLNGAPSGNPSLFGKTRGKDDETKKNSRDTYDGEFRNTDYFDFEYTMQQFREFYAAEQEAFRKWREEEEDAFQEFLRSEQNGY